MGLAVMPFAAEFLRYFFFYSTPHYEDLSLRHKLFPGTDINTRKKLFSFLDYRDPNSKKWMSVLCRRHLTVV